IVPLVAIVAQPLVLVTKPPQPRQHPHAEQEQLAGHRQLHARRPVQRSVEVEQPRRVLSSTNAQRVGVARRPRNLEVNGALAHHSRLRRNARPPAPGSPSPAAPATPTSSHPNGVITPAGPTELRLNANVSVVSGKKKNPSSGQIQWS